MSPCYERPFFQFDHVRVLPSYGSSKRPTAQDFWHDCIAYLCQKVEFPAGYLVSIPDSKKMQC